MILELELNLYKRLSLKNIRKFKWSFKSAIQILLGTNGSGKSQVMREMSPLPANEKDYHKGGLKRIVISHNGKIYELISDFTKTQEHYFNCDGVNLNPGRTITIQKELVKEHFNLTTERHEFRLGLEPFCKMSAARRKELLMQICVVDYTYAVKLYKKVVDEYNSMRNGIKLAKKRLQSETVNIINDIEVANLRDRLSVLTKQSQQLYMLRNANAGSMGTVTSNLHSAVNSINELTARFSGVRKALGAIAYFSPHEQQSTIDECKDNLAATQGIYGRLSEEFMQLTAELSDTIDVVGEDAVALQDEIIADRKLIDTLLEQRKQPLEGLNAVNASGSMELVYESLMSVLTALPSDPESVMSFENLTKTTERIKELERSININREKLNDCIHRERHLAELATGDNIDCPKCEHKWRVGYDDKTHAILKQRVEQGRLMVAALTKELDAMTIKQTELNEYATLYKEYIRITRNTPELLPLWELIDAENSIKVSPGHALSLIDLVRGDLSICMRVASIEDKIRGSLQRLKLVELSKSENTKEKRAKLVKLEEELGILSARKVLEQQTLQRHVNDLNQTNQLYTLGDRIREAQALLDRHSYAAIDSIKNSIIDESLVETHSEIATLSSRLNSIDQQTAIIRDIRKSIEDMEALEKAYKAISDALSPTDGLIAEGMLGFIRNFVARMNALIAKAWTYPLVVHDCSTEAETAELNYKFPLMSPNLYEPVPDVANGSAGQQEIVNLSFIVIASQCMKIDYGPLFLDEFGKTFDSAHQQAAVHLIGQLMEQLNFSQLFMISHYEDCYGAFYNAAISVLDASNIVVPSNRSYNEHLVMSA